MGKTHPAVIGGNACVAHPSSRLAPREREVTPVETSVSVGADREARQRSGLGAGRLELTAQSCCWSLPGEPRL